MDLFASAGIQLAPASAGGGGSGRRARSIARTLHVPLFNAKVVEDASRENSTAFTPEPQDLARAADYARKVRDPKFLKQKETAVRSLLIQEVLQGLLGYAPYDPGAAYSLSVEHSIRGGAVDVALGRFNAAEGVDDLVAPFELKGPGSADLERVDPGRKRSPVQQAWDYAIDSPGARWVLVSNCLEIRLYAFGRGRDAYEIFDLTRLDEAAEHERLWRILAARNLLGGPTDQLLRDTDSAYQTVTGELYAQYSGLRRRLIDFLQGTGDGGPALPRLQAVEIAQKLLDRILFIAFAQRTDLLRDRLLEEAANTLNAFAPQPLWNNFLGLFRWVDSGNGAQGIPAYNGGLFARDPVADAILIPDHLAVELAGLGEWDYRRELPVTVLGRLFEQSISDLESLRSDEAQTTALPTVSRRKREGVVYTPDRITRFLVERTLGLSLDERRDALWTLHGMEAAPDAAAQTAFWRACLESLRAFTVVDPACGSGAFLVAAFDELARRYREAVSALDALDAPVDFDPYDEIVTRNLFGVDVNAESVEITRLSLWLKTARRHHRLQRLEATIREGDSLVEDAAYAARPFDWRAAFPQVFEPGTGEDGGFDVVIGNPPYVRMELLKAVKPYLTQRYLVADERTDLYAYFFERGIQVLRPGGRLGFISSSTFFKTGSGEKLRTFLGDGVAIETVVDFGDAQLFEGVTTYPAILTARKAAEPEGALTFLNVRGPVPDDLGRAVIRDGRVMPRARLGRGSWQFEEDALAALRAKIADGRPTLGEVYGSPMNGIKTGLNQAFVVDRSTRDRMVNADPRSAELLKPFLSGEEAKRWLVAGEDCWLINTTNGAFSPEDYPAILSWLAPFRDQLERRAKQTRWWELQRSRPSYQPKFAHTKVVWGQFQQRAEFAHDETGSFLNNKCFFLDVDAPALVALLNSNCLWFQLRSIARPKRGGYIEAEAQYVEQLHLPQLSAETEAELARLGQSCAAHTGERRGIERAVAHRILDLAPSGRAKLPGKLQAWHALDFKGFLAAIKAAWGAELKLSERAEWEGYLALNAAEVRRLSAAIETAERAIDRIVYDLYALTPAEVTLLEGSLQGQY